MISCRETQLRSFYSTTEEIQVLFAKQQEQLKAMQRTLEDEENYENTSVDMDGVIGGTSGREKDVAEYHSNSAAKAGSTTSAQKLKRDQIETSSNEASVTEKHDCDIRSEECQNTQEAEFTSADHDHGVRDGFGSDVDGVGTAVMMEGDDVGTERVLETESPANYGERTFDLNKGGPIEGDTMQFDDDIHVQETEKHAPIPCRELSQHSRSNNHVDTERTTEGTKAGGAIGTEDLLASEVAGSWACNTAPSLHGENESPRSRDNIEGSGALHDSTIMVAESQSTPDADATRRDERRALSEMIGIVAPDLREQFGGSAYDCNKEREDHGGSSDSDTESCSDTGNDDRANAKGGSVSDEETQGNDHVEEDQKQDDSMNEDDEATQED